MRTLFQNSYFVLDIFQVLFLFLSQLTWPYQVQGLLYRGYQFMYQTLHIFKFKDISCNMLMT